MREEICFGKLTHIIWQKTLAKLPAKLALARILTQFPSNIS
jgi:hypothetical protein